MSTFGSETIFMVLVIGCAIAVPIFGWWPIAGAAIIAYGWTVLLADANRKFNSDGTIKSRRRRSRRGKRN